LLLDKKNKVDKEIEITLTRRIKGQLLEQNKTNNITIKEEKNDNIIRLFFIAILSLGACIN
tara:strand:+ start:57 stop:239 length:183 start_codon:yes stop_codon:yes gene_type:complete